jgi:hypothetical protein
MEVEGEAEVADLEVVVEEDSGDDGNGFYDNLAYLLAFRAGSWNTCIINAIKMKRVQGFSRGQARNCDVNVDRVGNLKISIYSETQLEIIIELF